MAFAWNTRTAVEGAAATAASALLIYLGDGMNPIWPLVWIAWIPVLWFALRSPWWMAAAACGLATFLGNLNTWSYFTKTLGLPSSAWCGMFALASILVALGALLFRALVQRGAYWMGLISLPAYWVACEFSRNVTTPHGTAGSLAYSQLAFLPFLQLASITGPWGMTFVLLALQCAVAIWLNGRGSSTRTPGTIVLTALGTLAAILLFGAVRLQTSPQDRVRVGLIASDLPQNDKVVDAGAETARLLNEYANAARALTAQGAQAIVIPEKVGVVRQADSTSADGVLQSLADETGATVVAGMLTLDGAEKFNEARIYAPRARVSRYDKQHMLPPFESDLKPGSALTLLPRGEQRWGVAICKDMDFRSPANAYGRAGAGLMLVPAWDFVVDAGWHGHISVMRGVEEGFSMARAAKNGYLTVSDSRGRIVREVRSNSAPFATLLADVAATHVGTVYQRLGNWFAWASILLAILALADLVRRMATRR